jgi:hypothetical protein
MLDVQNEMETIHLYVVREQEKKPFVVLPLLSALLCLSVIVGVTIYSAFHPYYEHETLRVPATFLPLKTFRVSVPVIPTGRYIVRATTAHGILTLTNGSVISQDLPAGMIFTGISGETEVITDSRVFVPAGSANGFGIATVSAHAVVSGKIGNIPAYTIDRVEGSSIYIRNLSLFTGGRDAYSVKVVTPQDKQRALDQARTVLAHSVHMKAILVYPCTEKVTGNVAVSWQCQFITFHVPLFMRVTRTNFLGNNLFVDVVFVPRPKPFLGK